MSQLSLPLSVEAFSRIQSGEHTFNAQIKTTIVDILNTLTDGAKAAEEFRVSSSDDEDEDEDNADARQSNAMNASIDSTVGELDTIYRQVMDLQSERDLLSHAVNVAVAQRARQDESQLQSLDGTNHKSHKVGLLSDLVLEKHRQLKESYLVKPESERYGHTNSQYVSFRQELWDVHDTPPSQRNINKLFSDYVDDDDVVEELARESFKCPLTKQFYEDPVTSSVCQHSFSKAAILDIFKNQMNPTIKCPIPACSHHFTAKQLKPNEGLAKRAKRDQQREMRETQARMANLDRL